MATVTRQTVKAMCVEDSMESRWKNFELEIIEVLVYAESQISM
jgi:hypothetical protein